MSLLFFSCFRLQGIIRIDVKMYRKRKEKIFRFLCSLVCRFEQNSFGCENLLAQFFVHAFRTFLSLLCTSSKSPPPNTHAIFGNLALSSVQSVFVCRPNSKQFSTFVTSIIKFNALLFRLFLSLPQQAGCLEAFLFPLRGAFGQSQQNARKKSATRLRQKAKKKQQKTM